MFTLIVENYGYEQQKEKMLDFHVNHVIWGEASYSKLHYDDYDNIEKITNYLEQVELKINAYLSSVTKKELSMTIKQKLREWVNHHGSC